jgi:hypothetical protein
MDHLTETQIRAFLERKLPYAELMEYGEHLASCKECQAALEADASANQPIDLLREDLQEPEPHLNYEQVRMLAEGETVDKALILHMSRCKACAAEVEDLKRFAEELPVRPRVLPNLPEESRASWLPRLTPVWSTAIAAGLLVVSVGVFWWVSRLVQNSSDVVATVQDGGRKLQLSSDGKLLGAEGLSTPMQAALLKAIHEGRIESATPFAYSNKPEETILGASTNQNSFHLIYPVAELSADDQPTFQWQPMEGAEHYRVSIFGAGYKLIAESDDLQSTSWRSTAQLTRDTVYTWTVTATAKNKIVRVPSPPAPEAAFKVLSADEASKIADAHRDHPNDHLLLAILDAQAGLLTDAHKELDQLQAENPDSSLVAKIKASFDQRPPSPIKTNGAQ